MVTVRLPLSLFPEPYPVFNSPGESGSFEGYWDKQEDGKVIHTNISNYFCRKEPKNRTLNFGSESDRIEFSPKIYFPEFKSENDKYEQWSYWEGLKLTREYNPEDMLGYGKLLSVENLDEQLVADYRKLRNWHSKYFHGDYDFTCEKLHPVLEAFLNAAGWAKTTYHYVDTKHNFVYRTYSVKYFYHYTKLQFCNGLNQAFRLARKHNIPVKLMRKYGF